MDDIEKTDETQTVNDQDQQEQAEIIQSEVSTEQDRQPEQEGSGLKAKAGGLAALIAILLKFKGILFIVLTKFKFLVFGFKLAKVFTTFGSMLITIVIDAMRWGWSFAVGFVFLLFIHEMGHVIALRMKGIKASAPLFIPGIGAFIGLKEMPKNAKDEAEVGIAGPVLGTLGAFLCLQLGGAEHNSLFTRLAYVGFFLNLFNLLPVLPLDGGRVVAAISPKVWIVGLVLAGLAFFATHNPILLIIIILSIGRMWHAFKMPPEEKEYYNVPAKTKLQMTAAYFLLAGYLAFMMMELHHRPETQRPFRVGQMQHQIVYNQTK